MKKILAALLCAATVLTISGCDDKVDLSGLIDDGGSGTGKGKRPGNGGGTGINADGSIDWDSVPYADEEDFEWEIGRTYDVVSIHANIQTIYITKYVGEDKVIKIPETIEGKPVTGVAGTSIGSCVFTKQSDISVCTPSSVSAIKNCFENCENVTLYVTEPKVPTKELEEYFYKNYPYTMSFDSNTFKGCKNVKVNLPSTGVQSISSGAFAWCTDVDAITLPDSVTNVAKDAFDKQSIPKSITYKGTTYNASQYSEFLEVFNSMDPPPADDPRPFEDGELGHSTLKIEDDIFGMGHYTLYGVPRSYQGAYTVPDKVRFIEDYAFTGCTGLITIVLHGNLSIGEKAFDGYEGNIVLNGKSYKASEFNYAEARKEALNAPLTDWDSVPYASESDFEYKFLGVLWTESVSIIKYKGTSKKVEIPERIKGARGGSLSGEYDFDTVFSNMPDMEILLPENVSLSNVFSGCGGTRLYLPDSNINKSGVTNVINSGVAVVFKGKVYDKEHLQDFLDALDGKEPSGATSSDVSSGVSGDESADVTSDTSADVSA